MNVNDLLAEASAAPPVQKEHRHTQYNPVIRELTEKGYTTAQIKDWFKARGITVRAAYISALRTADKEAERVMAGARRPESEGTMTPEPVRVRIRTTDATSNPT